MDIIEINEAFASQVLGCLRLMNVDFKDPRVNPNGGAIAIGHPLGCSGARLALTVSRELQQIGRQVRRGVAVHRRGPGPRRHPRKGAMMNAPLKTKPKAQFDWGDPFLLDQQLTEDERMVRDAARRLLPGQARAARAGSVPPREDRPRDLPRDGRARPARPDDSRRVRRPGAQLRLPTA